MWSRRRRRLLFTKIGIKNNTFCKLIKIIDRVKLILPVYHPPYFGIISINRRELWIIIQILWTPTMLWTSLNLPTQPIWVSTECSRTLNLQRESIKLLTKSKSHSKKLTSSRLKWSGSKGVRLRNLRRQRRSILKKGMVLNAKSKLKMVLKASKIKNLLLP